MSHQQRQPHSSSALGSGPSHGRCSSIWPGGGRRDHGSRRLRAHNRGSDALQRGRHPLVHRGNDVLGYRWLFRGRVDRLRAGLSGPQSRSRMDQLRTAAPRSHLGRDLRLRRQRAARDLALRRAADLPRPPLRWAASGDLPLLGLPALHRPGRDRLRHRRDRIQRICRAGMVHRYLAHHRLGRLSRRLLRDDPEAQGATHLRGELVLPRLHRHDRDASHRQQSLDSGLDLRHQELLALLRRPGCADAVVVRPQRGGLLPHCRLPRHDVLLRAQAGRAADLLIPPLDHPLLGSYLSLHLGRALTTSTIRRCPIGRRCWA